MIANSFLKLDNSSRKGRPVKASARKEVERMLAVVSGKKKARRLQEEYDCKGFLSKKEVKILTRLAEDISVQQVA